MRIAIVDDERASRSELKYCISEFLSEATISEADSGEGALELFAQQTFDVAFLDINLGDMDGMTLAERLRQKQPQLAVVFSTAYSEYAAKAFELEAADYILKPFSQQRVRMALRKVITSAPEKRATVSAKPQEALKRIPIASDKKIILLDIPDILYIEKENRICKLCCKSGVYQTTQTLDQLEKQLAGQAFLRIHKSFIVNLNCISEIQPSFNSSYTVHLHLPSNASLPVSRLYIRALKEALNF